MDLVLWSESNIPPQSQLSALSADWLRESVLMEAWRLWICDNAGCGRVFINIYIYIYLYIAIHLIKQYCQRAEKLQIVLPTIVVASGGTKIVLCLLPRLRHWQHDVAIHSQYCISPAFCEKVPANLSPQSIVCQCDERSGQGTGWRRRGSAPSLHISPSSPHQQPLPHSSPVCTFSPGGLGERRRGSSWGESRRARAVSMRRPRVIFSVLCRSVGAKKKGGKELNGRRIADTIKL